MKENLLKRFGPDVAAIVLFVLLAVAYFITPLTEGLVLTGHDTTGGVGAGHERMEYLERTGEDTRWTNALFSGMPTYQIAPSYSSQRTLSSLLRIYELGLSDCVMYVFILLLGAYILMRAFGFKPLIGVLGAVAWAFSSYFFIIIGAGHIWKVLTLAFIPPTVAGMVLCYRGRYLAGGLLSAFFIAWQILSNHLQMTYYFLFVLFFLALGFLIQALQEKKLGQYFKGVGVFVVAGLIGISLNASNLFHTYQYSKQTMRGQSELTQPRQTGSASKGKSGGLSHEYITQWSYGVGETWTLLVPNAKGGASGALFENEKAQQNSHFSSYNQSVQQLYPQLGASTPGLSAYWGDQPGTAGPVYVGAFICFLFVLGLFIVRGPIKWTLLFLTVFSILLSWGHNFAPLTDWFIDNFPMYNKFRAVSSILVIAEFTIPLLGIMALVRIVKEPDVLQKKAPFVIVSLVLTAGASLLFALAPGVLGDALTSAEQMIFGRLQQAFDPQFVAQYKGDVIAIRESIFSSDAWRSFFIILIGVALLWIYSKGKLRSSWLVAGITLLCLVDLWQVNKRYLNDNNFVEPYQKEQTFQKTATDEQILQDTALDYRVLNFAGDTFNENTTSYWHKSIGGYHAAKLARYQDIINHCLVGEMKNFMTAINKAQGDMTQIPDSVTPVLNMLNARWFIMPLQNNQTAPLQNLNAMGNAWFVSTLKYVDGAREEMKALKTVDLRTCAVADAEFSKELGEAYTDNMADTTRRVTLTSYEPNKLCYDVQSLHGGLVVLSEIYYPGWTATLDGRPIEIGRANYILRAVRVPEGTHRLELTFQPKTISETETLAYVALAILLLSLLAAVVFGIRKMKGNNTAEKPQENKGKKK